jgi:hypothetical protein
MFFDNFGLLIHTNLTFTFEGFWQITTTNFKFYTNKPIIFYEDIITMMVCYLLSIKVMFYFKPLIFKNLMHMYIYLILY